MNTKMNNRTVRILATALLIVMAGYTQAQSIAEWYATAQERIDTLRRGAFGLQIMDKNDQPFTGEVKVRMKKHEYPFGIAFDLYEGAVANGNSYSTTSAITAPVDAEIYQSERWFSFIAYAIPVEAGRDFNLTLKFAEIYFSTAGSRIFDVYVEGTKYLSDFDMVAASGGQNIAIDTTIPVSSSDGIINIELVSSLDNAAIKGIVAETVEQDWITRINCGGGALTTTDGNAYLSDEDFFDEEAARYPTEEQWMKAAMQKYFNYGVSGNSFKWSGIQPEHTAPDYTNFDHAVEWTQSIGWDLRAHTLLWGGYEYTSDHELPRWVKDLPTPEAITDTCKMRVVREMTRYKGIVKEYDVMNEPLHARYLSDVVGDSINWNCFKWARSADPDAELFINDYNVEYNWGDAAAYRDMINEIKAMGGPVTGVGMQAHFWQDLRPNVTELVTNVNIVAEAGLPIKFTEFDNGDMPEEEQAKDFVMVMTVAFSHPMINGIINWALSDRGAWRENSGLFTANHRPKLTADTLWYLTKERWATNFDTTLATTDPMLFDAYYGDYIIEVTFGDTVKVFTIPCLQANEDSVFVLHENDAILKGPVLQLAELSSDTTLLLHFDKKIDPATITAGNFKFFTDNPLRIQKIACLEADSSTLQIDLQGVVTPDDFLCVSYFPGTLAAKDGAMALAFGPETVKNLTTGLISADVTNDGTTIEATFNTGIRNLLDNMAAFTFTDNGSAIVPSSVEYHASDSAIAVFNFATPLTSSSKPTIQYTRGTIVPAAGFDCQSSGVIEVNNIWPKVVEAILIANGTQVRAQFQTELQNVTDNMGAFMVSADGASVEISGISETGTDSTQVRLDLATVINAGTEVTLSYVPGTVEGVNGNNLEAFDNLLVTNNSTITAISPVEENGLILYPNPAHDQIVVEWNQPFNELAIFNLEGKAVVQEHYAASVVKTTLPLQLSPGLYIVRLSQGTQTVEKQLIIK